MWDNLVKKNKKTEKSKDYTRLNSDIKQLKEELSFLKSQIEINTIPLSVFSEELSSLETVSKFFKENKLLTNKKIAELTNRSAKTISQAYTTSKKKYPNKLVYTYSEFHFPLEILRNRKLSVLENIVVYIKEKYELNYSAIATLLHRDPRTVWTIYQRALKKGGSIND